MSELRLSGDETVVAEGLNRAQNWLFETGFALVDLGKLGTKEMTYLIDNEQVRVFQIIKDTNYTPTYESNWSWRSLSRFDTLTHLKRRNVTFNISRAENGE